ncbi:hypothetical protein [uncultured Roseobacter sp.]|uniref:hypothetical protein n=1 Tax=uncultured Roseobacter sp. TaxID=114847 RepID=UPI00262B6CAB|nr:hypothetical protein [uncultured Roseobacter sp.]
MTHTSTIEAVKQIILKAMRLAAKEGFLQGVTAPELMKDGNGQMEDLARAFAHEAMSALQSPPSPSVQEAASKLLKMRDSITSDIQSAHSGRGVGASQWMREDDQDFRKSLRETFDALERALSEGDSDNG